MKKQTVLCIFILFMCVQFFITACKTSKYSQTDWESVAHLYAFAVSYPEHLPAFIEENKVKFESDGNWLKCAELLSSNLISNALDTYTPDETYKQAMSIASNAGAPELGSKVADSMNKTAVEMFRIGTWLGSFSNSVIEIRNGNSNAYFATEEYSLLKTMWDLLGMQMPQNDISATKKIMYNLNIWMMMGFAQQLQ